jgi:hypothetical protein
MTKKTLYVIGTGPSLRDIDMSLLKDKDTITFNRAYVAYEDWGFTPTYYMCIDANDLRSIYGDIKELTETTDTKFFLSKTTDNDKHDPEDFWQEEWVNDKDMIPARPNVTFISDSIDTKEGQRYGIKFMDIWESRHPDPNRNEIKMDVVPNAGCLSITLAFILWGYDEVAFVGCDCRYKNDDESNKHLVKKGKSFRSTENYDVNHFRDDYFGKNITFGAPNEEEIIYVWGTLVGFLPLIGEYTGKDHQVYSCTPGSNANAFYPYISLKNFTKGSREIEIPPSVQPGWVYRNEAGHIRVNKTKLGVSPYVPTKTDNKNEE